MSPRTGRPRTESPKNVKMNIRISEQTAADLLECSEKLSIPKVVVIEKGIQLVKKQLKK